MNIGSLREVKNRSTEQFIESIDLDDRICILGEVALHHTLMEDDVMYLYEFAAMNEADKMVKVTVSHADMNDSVRKDIDSYHSINTDSENDFNANKKTLTDRIDKNLNLLKGSSNEKAFQGEIDRLESLKKRIQEEQYPKSWLAKKIQWFRNLYAKFMHKNTASPEPGIKGIIKRILAAITRIIDMLAKKLQNAVN